MEFILNFKGCQACPFSWAEYPECELAGLTATNGAMVYPWTTPSPSARDKRPDTCPFKQDGTVTIRLVRP